MAAHILTAITDELRATMTRPYERGDYELLIQCIGHSFPFNQIDFDEYDEIKKWCQEGTRLLDEGLESFDHQHNFRYIAWKIIARLYPEWIKLGKPKCYEDWMDAKYPPKEKEDDPTNKRTD